MAPGHRVLGSGAGAGSKVQRAGPDQEASCITTAVIITSPALHLLPVCSRPPLQADEERPNEVCLALHSNLPTPQIQLLPWCVWSATLTPTTKWKKLEHRNEGLS